MDINSYIFLHVVNIWMSPTFLTVVEGREKSMCVKYVCINVEFRLRARVWRACRYSRYAFGSPFRVKLIIFYLFLHFDAKSVCQTRYAIKLNWWLNGWVDFKVAWKIQSHRWMKTKCCAGRERNAICAWMMSFARGQHQNRESFSYCREQILLDNHSNYAVCTWWCAIKIALPSQTLQCLLHEKMMNQKKKKNYGQHFRLHNQLL